MSYTGKVNWFLIRDKESITHDILTGRQPARSRTEWPVPGMIGITVLLYILTGLPRMDSGYLKYDTNVVFTVRNRSRATTSAMIFLLCMRPVVVKVFESTLCFAFIIQAASIF